MLSPFTVERLEACVHQSTSAATASEALESASEVLEVLSSRAALAEAGVRSTCGTHGVTYDYIGISSACERLVGQTTSKWPSHLGEALRTAALRALPRQPPQAPALHLAHDVAPHGMLFEPGGVDEFDAELGDVQVERTNSLDGSSDAGGSSYGRATIAAAPPHDAPERAGEGLQQPQAPPHDAPENAGDGQQPAGDAEVAPCAPTEDEDDTAEPCGWVGVLLAAVLPMLTDALPRDHSGVCIIPHPHRMARQQAPFSGRGLTMFQTNKICDNCGQRIEDRFFFHCSQNCDIDFCWECHRKSQELLSNFLERAGDASREAMYRRLFWVIDITERIGFHVLRRSVQDRARLAHELAFEWSTPMFERLTQAAVDVVNAKVVHVQDVKDITSDLRFWYAVGWLQFLYSANSLPCNTRRVDEQGTRGPKVEYERFILDGINKCEPVSEFSRWREHPSAKVPDVLSIETFDLTADFCSFLTHTNLVPVSFRRVCLLCDVWEQITQTGRAKYLELEVSREPRALLEQVVTFFQGFDDSELRRPLRVTFTGEEAVGAGVMREFFQVALRSFLDGGVGAASEADGRQSRLFRCNGQRRTYWFDEDVDNAAAYRACGILLGQAVLNNIFVPNIFPRVLYERLLHDLDSPCARPLIVEDLATVSEEVANTLQKVLDYTDEDIGAAFGDLGWARTGRIGEDCVLSQHNKVELVQAFVHWFLIDRVALQFEPLSAGFRAILGDSSILRCMVDSVQLEKIVCGGTVPVDVAAIQRGASEVGWTQEEQSEYLPWFWEVFASFSETQKVQFLVFVTASDRVPLRGWQDLDMKVQKNGVGDDRLPTAFTCFCQLLLPRYSTYEELRAKLLLAIGNSEGFGLR